jgi:hypothetical protein
LLKATNKITAYAPQIEHQPCKPLNRPRQNAMPDTHLVLQLYLQRIALLRA